LSNPFEERRKEKKRKEKKKKKLGFFLLSFRMHFPPKSSTKTNFFEKLSPLNFIGYSLVAKPVASFLVYCYV